MVSNGNGDGFIGALATILAHPIGKLLLGAGVWLLSFAYAMGAVKTEIRTLKEQVTKVETQVKELSDYIRDKDSLR